MSNKNTKPAQLYSFSDEHLDLLVDDFLQLPINHDEKIALIGYFPETNQILTEGEIWLCRGRHAWKYGLDHIWQGRKSELQKRGVCTIRQLINFLIILINRRTPIYPEPEHYKAAVIKSSKGAVIVEKIDDKYSIVTLLLATHTKPLPVEKRWGNQKLNTIKKDCKTI